MGIRFTNGRVSTPGNYSPPSPANSHTISLWMQISSNTGGIQRPMASNDLWEFRMNGALLVEDDFLTTGATSFSASLNTPYHMVFVTNGPASSKALYVNGVLVQNNPSASLVTAGTTPLSFGTRIGTSNFFNGVLSDVRRYDRVLTQDEVETIYACQGTDNILDGLTNWWVMDDTAENVAVTRVEDVIGSATMTVVAGTTPTGSGDLGLKTRRRV